MLQDKELANLTNSLQVPMIMQDLLEGRETLEPDVRYGIHEILSEYYPDSALLCLALSARKIATFLQKRYGLMRALKLECDRIVEEYAPLWLDHAYKRTLDETTLFETLSQIPEDLESLAELLEVDAVFLRGEEPLPAELCRILSLQARAQILVAESYLEAYTTQIEKQADALPMLVSLNNVIPFPVQNIRA